jgi:hypothetical protein
MQHRDCSSGRGRAMERTDRLAIDLVTWLVLLGCLLGARLLVSAAAAGDGTGASGTPAPCYQSIERR